jgi:hypothetical protein
MDPPPLFLSVDGEGRTGKTFTVDVITKELVDLLADPGGFDPVVRAAPTGIAANNIAGYTLHSLFRLPVQSEFTPLSTGNVGTLQARLKNKLYLIINEKSMISLR